MAAPISTTYTPEERTELIKRICGLIIQSSVAKACKEVGIAECTFYAWVAADEELAQEYARARKAISYRGESELENINAQVAQAQLEPAAARVMADNIKWLMGKRNAPVYGDKTDITSDGKQIKAATIVVASEADKKLLEDI